MKFSEYVKQTLQSDVANVKQRKSQKEILQGYTVEEQGIPDISESYITFRSPDGKSFSLNKSLLSRHILLLGGIGVGKTNTFNHLIHELFKKDYSETKDNVTVIFDTKEIFSGSSILPEIL